MATWTTWEYIDTCNELTGDANQAWNTGGSALSNGGEDSVSMPTTVGEYSNRISIYGWDQMWAAYNLTDSHRLRELQLRFECRQGLAVFADRDPCDIHTYWASGYVTYHPPKDFSWPGTVFTDARSLNQWGFDLGNDGANAMAQLLANTARLRLRVHQKDGGTVPVYVRNIDARIAFDDPVPPVPGMLMGVV